MLVLLLLVPERILWVILVLVLWGVMLVTLLLVPERILWVILLLVPWGVMAIFPPSQPCPLQEAVSSCNYSHINTVYYALYTVYCTLYTVPCALYILHYYVYAYSLFSLQCRVQSSHPLPRFLLSSALFNCLMIAAGRPHQNTALCSVYSWQSIEQR